jgi:hypothetical protein
MRCMKAGVYLFLLACLSFTVITGCSFLSFKKTTDKTQAKNAPPAGVLPSPAEWKDRKWENYAQDKSGVTYFFEKQTILYPAKNIIHVWRKRNLAAGARGLKEITSYDEIDCKNERYRTLELQGINTDGTKTDIFRKPSPWSAIFLESADEYFLNNFCKEAATAAHPEKR